MSEQTTSPSHYIKFKANELKIEVRLSIAPLYHAPSDRVINKRLGRSGKTKHYQSEEDIFLHMVNATGKETARKFHKGTTKSQIRVWEDYKALSISSFSQGIEELTSIIKRRCRRKLNKGGK